MPTFSEWTKVSENERGKTMEDKVHIVMKVHGVYHLVNSGNAYTREEAEKILRNINPTPPAEKVFFIAKLEIEP